MLAVVFALLASVAPPIENVSTHCATQDVVVGDGVIDKVLVGCGSGYADDVLWNLDVSDSVRDGSVTRAARGRGAVVYVIDSGIEASHDEMRRDDGTSKVIAGLDSVYGSLTPPTTGTCAGDSATHPCFTSVTISWATHGTAVASVVAGRTTGIAPSASLVAVRTQTSSGFFGGSQMDIFIRCLDDIVNHAYDPSTPPFRTAIVTMSNIPSVLASAAAKNAQWGEFERKVRLMIGGVDANFNADPNGKRFLFTILAGNNNFDSRQTGLIGHCLTNNDVAYALPALGASLDGLITVGGAARDGGAWSGSCGGPAVDVLAPAESILCASMTSHDRYRGTVSGVDMTSGTSYAAPYVAGIAARLLEIDPTLTPVQLEQRIKAIAVAMPGGLLVVLDERPTARHHRAASH